MAIEERPRIVCLCGSSKYLSAFEVANRDETLAGRIVLSIGVDVQVRDRDYLAAIHAPAELEAIKTRLERLQRHRIDLADEILVLDVHGPNTYGSLTKREIEYAREIGKTVRFWSKEHRESTDS